MSTSSTGFGHITSKPNKLPKGGLVSISNYRNPTILSQCLWWSGLLALRQSKLINSTKWRNLIYNKYINMSLLYYICIFHIADHFLQHGTVLSGHHIQHWTDNLFPWVQICMVRLLQLHWSSIVRFFVVQESFVVHWSPDILHIPRLWRTCLISRKYKSVYIGDLPEVGIWLCCRVRRLLSSLGPHAYTLPTYLLRRSFFLVR